MPTTFKTMTTLHILNALVFLFLFVIWSSKTWLNFIIKFILLLGAIGNILAVTSPHIFK